MDDLAQKLAKTKIWLDSEPTRLKTLCQTETAQDKIALLAAYIIRKHLPIAKEYEVTSNRLDELYDQMQAAKKRFYSLDNNFSSLKQNRTYRVIQFNHDTEKKNILDENGLAAIIADALMSEPYAVPLVACSIGNNLEMDKDWELMSDLDKDEFIKKKIVREL